MDFNTPISTDLLKIPKSKNHKNNNQPGPLNPTKMISFIQYFILGNGQQTVCFDGRPNFWYFWFLVRLILGRAVDRGPSEPLKIWVK